jgi:hypothetical protein
MTDSQTRSAAFVRGFFSFLESRQVRSAVLHGGADGFERELSDVDFVVDGGTFPQLPARIDEYCAQAGWLLCQVLRHETTAAYFVCSAVDDPACSVALDACSDYQRNGSVFLRAETFLQNRQALAWGGHRLSPANELRYRFCKAAAKNKPATTCKRSPAGPDWEHWTVSVVWLRWQCFWATPWRSVSGTRGSAVGSSSTTCSMDALR